MVIALTVAACGSSDDDSPSEPAGQPSSGGQAAPAGLVKPGHFTVCTDTTFPPMEYTEGSDREPRGYDISTIKAVSALWNVKPVFKVTAFDGLFPAVSAGRCDVAWSSIYVTPERTKAFAVVPYGRSRTVFIVASGNKQGIKSVDDLAGKTLAAQSGTALLETAQKIAADLERDGKKPPKIQIYKNATDLIQQLIVGRADAAPTIDLEAQYRTRKTPGQFDIAFPMPDVQEIGVYFEPDKKPIGDAVARALQALEGDGTLARLAKQEGFPVEGIAVGEVRLPGQAATTE